MLLEKLKQQLKEEPKGLIKTRGYKKRYLTVEREGIKINPKKVEAEKKYDGKYVITSNTELKAEEIALAYRELCLPATDRVVRFKCGDKSYLVRTELNGKAYLGFRAAGLAVPPRVLELGKNVVGTSEITPVCRQAGVKNAQI